MLRRGTTRARRALRGSACAALLAAASSGCASREPQPFTIEIAVRAEEGRPVAGARVRVRSDETLTNASGLASLRVAGKAGELVPVSLSCPPGFLARVPDSALVLPSAGDAPPAPLTRELACQTQQREAVVLVHASGGATRLPVKVDGRVVGQTDSLGFAHVHVRGNPQSSLEVSLDTSSYAGLSPQHPTQHFQLESGDEVFVFDTAFQSQKASRRKGRRVSRSRSSAGTSD